MDPDEILEEIRKTTNAILEGTAVDFETLDLYGLCELVDALDTWMTGGSFAPKVWKRY